MNLTPPTFSSQTTHNNVIVSIGVAIAIFEDQWRILFEKRSDRGLWGFPGGREESKVSIIETALREVREETGLIVEITHLLGVFSDPDDRIVTFPDNTVHLIDILLDILLEAVIEAGALIRSAESTDLYFFSLNALPPESEILPPPSNR